MILSYKYRIYPNATQAVALSEMLRDFCDLYNAALQQRIEAYRRKSVSLNYYDQAKELKSVREGVPELARWSFTAEQQVLRRLQKTFSAFFTRKRGFPRFRAAARYHAAEFQIGGGLVLRKSGKLRFVGVPGEIKVKWHRDMPSRPKAAVLTRQTGRWFVVFAIDVPAQDRANQKTIGIDLGLVNLIALSNGETIPRPNWTKRAARGLRCRQRAIARCKRGSKVRSRRKISIARYHGRIANRRRDDLHKLSRDLVNRFGRIAIEDLNVKGLASGMLAKHVNDAAWAQLTAMLSYKAESAGGEIIRVDPRGTSQTCPGCGTIAKKSLAERTHHCDCGCVLDRDVAAAMVVHYKAFSFWPGAGLESLSVPGAA